MLVALPWSSLLINDPDLYFSSSIINALLTFLALNSCSWKKSLSSSIFSSVALSLFNILLWSLHILSSFKASLLNQSLSFSKFINLASYLALCLSLDAFSLSSLISFMIAYILFLKATKKSFSWSFITSDILVPKSYFIVKYYWIVKYSNCVIEFIIIVVDFRWSGILIIYFLGSFLLDVHSCQVQRCLQKERLLIFYNRNCIYIANVTSLSEWIVLGWCQFIFCIEWISINISFTASDSSRC